MIFYNVYFFSYLVSKDFRSSMHLIKHFDLRCYTKVIRVPSRPILFYYGNLYNVGIECLIILFLQLENIVDYYAN